MSDKAGLYLGFEGREAVLLRALEKTSAAGLNNLLFSRIYVRDLNPIFAEGELDGIFLNFSDPWPKGRHSKRRLTSPEYLGMYGKILSRGGFIEFKTDSYDFFAYSKNSFQNNPCFCIDAIIENLHDTNNSSSRARVLSEYEERFIRWNRRIYLIKAIRV